MAVSQRHEDIVAELMSLVNERDRETCRLITDCLLGLGYLPRREKVKGYLLSFHSPRTGQTIAKIGAPADADRDASFFLKFYACNAPPPRFVVAVREAVESSNRQYRCLDCGVCGASEADRGYRLELSDHEDFVRCGAYVVRIPGLRAADESDFLTLLLEQHQYFLDRDK